MYIIICLWYNVKGDEVNEYIDNGYLQIRVSHMYFPIKIL